MRGQKGYPSRSVSFCFQRSTTLELHVHAVTPPLRHYPTWCQQLLLSRTRTLFRPLPFQPPHEGPDYYRSAWPAILCVRDARWYDNGRPGRRDSEASPAAISLVDCRNVSPSRWLTTTYDGGDRELRDEHRKAVPAKIIQERRAMGQSVDLEGSILWTVDKSGTEWRWRRHMCMPMSAT